MENTPKTRPGIQSRLVQKTGIAQSTISQIFSGKRRATVEQAIALEPHLIAEGLSVTRWDLMTCPRGTKLMDLVHNI
jgi:DNA-binding transcriptional regulator YdaS (Cro superfamily)